MEKGIIYVYFNRAKYEKEGIEKYYVGQTIRTMEQRAGKDGTGYNWDDPNCNSKFAKSIRKWGWNAFEGRVLEEVYEEDLDELEKFYIEQFDSFKNGYNSTLGGEGNYGHSHNEETKKKISKAGKKRYEDSKYREKQSEAMKKHFQDPKYRENVRIANKKRYEDPKIREKVSEAIKKHYEDPKAREKQSKAIKKRYEDPKEREKVSIANKKRWQDPKARKRQSEKLYGEKHPCIKNVYCNELCIVFSYVELAKKYCVNILNIKIGQICIVCDGKRKSTGKLTDGTKLTWSWVEDVDQETLKNATYIDSKKYEELLSQNVNDCK